MEMRRKRGKKRVVQPDLISTQVFNLALNKLLTDYLRNRQAYKDGIEKYFEDWLSTNFYTWTVDFENKLLRAFIALVLLRGRQPEKKK